jgi:hypothetical protein
MRKLFTTAALALVVASPAAASLSNNIRVAQAEVAVRVSAPVPDEKAPAVVTLDATYVMHNGSGMAMTQSFNGSIAHVEIRYDKPRVGISATPGTILFTGTYDGKRNWYSGVAYVFKKGCPPEPYPVTGIQGGPGIVLLGSPPIRDQNSCVIVGYVPETRDSMDHDKRVRLVFEFEPE